MSFKVLNVFILLISSSQAVIFNCHFYDWGWQSGEQYTCVLYGTVTAGNNTSLENVTGNHQGGRTNAHVGGLIIHGPFPFNRLPSNIENFFPNLKGIEFFNGSLTTIFSGDLKPFPHLRDLYIRFNLLVTIDGDLFKHTRSIKTLLFDNNLIEHIGENLLTGLEELNTIGFTKNRCLDFSAKSPIDIDYVTKKLSNLCPPLETIECPSTPRDCNVMCSGDEEINKLNALIMKLNERIDQLTQIIIINEERFVESEKQIRELHSNPLLPKTLLKPK